MSPLNKAKILSFAKLISKGGYDGKGVNKYHIFLIYVSLNYISYLKIETLFKSNMQELLQLLKMEQKVFHLLSFLF